MTAPLYRADIPLGLGLVATITITKRDHKHTGLANDTLVFRGRKDK